MSLGEHDGQGTGKPIKSQQWLSRKQVAEVLGVSVSTLERWHRKGIGPKAYRVAGLRLLRYDCVEVDAFVVREGA